MRVVLLSRLPLFAVFAALLLLTWVLFHWISAFLAPRQQGNPSAVSAPMLSKVLAEKAVALQLFGGAGSGNEVVPAAAQAAASNMGVRGVYAGRDGRSGFAVLVLDGKPLSAVVGQEFAPGRVLQRVYPDSVEILHSGQVETARMTSAAVSVPRTVKPSTTKGTTAALQMAVNQVGPGHYVFSREAMVATLNSPDQMPLLGQYAPNPRGGALLEQSPAGGLPEKLGLKVGDLVTRINGKPLSGPGDVARLNEQLIKSESVSMDVLRAGEKLKIGIQVEQ